MNDLVTILHGDCLDVLKTLPSDSVDSVVTDPPAGISFMGKKWDRHKGGRDQWVAWLAERFAECLRVAKPGAHALVWALPRTSHWTAAAIEDAGWVIEDRVAHIFGTGFPKHKSKLKPAVEDWWLATKPGGEKWLGVDACRIEGAPPSVPQPAYDRKNGWPHGTGRNGEMSQAPGRWPTNLVLSHHPECKPNGTKKIKVQWSQATIGNYDNAMFPVDKNGVGKSIGYTDANGYEIIEAFDCHPDCPVRLMDEQSFEAGIHSAGSECGPREYGGDWKTIFPFKSNKPFPTAVRYGDHGGASRFFPRFEGYHPDCPIRLIDEQSGESKGDSLERMPRKSESGFGANFMDDDWTPSKPCQTNGFTDSGGASRFFPGFLYCPKANRKDRGEGNTHPTVKAEPLMRWLCKLVTPPGGTVLDPFAGSGSTGFAAEVEGFKSVLIEQDITYVEIIKNRLAAIETKTPLFG